MEILGFIKSHAELITLLGGMYVFSRDIKNDLRESNKRWHQLLTQIHSLDKKIYKLELKREK
jgi:hypothetical protein